MPEILCCDLIVLARFEVRAYNRRFALGSTDIFVLGWEAINSRDLQGGAVSSFGGESPSKTTATNDKDHDHDNVFFSALQSHGCSTAHLSASIDVCKGYCT